jgi:hypothetical protein
MPRRTTYNCKVCGTEKMSSNHWFVAHEDGTGLHFYRWRLAVSEGFLDDDGMEYLCGQVCANKLLDQFLTG